MDARPQVKNRRLGYLMTLGGGLGWAIGGSFGQQLFRLEQATANWLVPLRLLIAGLLLLGIALLKGQDLRAPFRSGKDARDMLLFSLFGAGASQYTYYSCIQHSNAAFATVISYLFPAVILLYQVIKSKKRPRAYESLAVLLVTLGAVTCTTNWDFSALAVSPPALFFGVVCAVTAAYNTVKPRGLLERLPLFTVMGESMLISGLVFLPICRPWEVAVILEARTFFFFSMVILVGTILAFCLYQRGVGLVGSLAGSILASIEPVGAVCIGYFFLKEPFRPLDLLGFLLILISVPLLALGQSKSAARASAEELSPETDESRSTAS